MNEREQQMLAKVQQLQEKLPQFADGRIDYTDAGEAVAINVFVEHGDTVLLLKRSENVRHYKGFWGSVTGYFDRSKQSVREKALEEVREETGISEECIRDVRIGEPFTDTDEERGLTWHIVPVRIVLSEKPDIALEGEHTEYAWVPPAEIAQYKIFPFLAKAYQQALK